jgi:hypothetical protein
MEVAQLQCQTWKSAHNLAQVRRKTIECFLDMVIVQLASFIACSAHLEILGEPL